MLRLRNILLILLVLFLIGEFYIYFYIYPAPVFPWMYFAKLGSILFGQEVQKLIKINLATYSLTTFENEQLVKEYEIVGMGHPKISPTPQGSFKILQKHEKTFSSLSRVWMPWSLGFYRGYYIHGVPYYPSGAPITTRYSLGCIRLTTPGAQELYQWAPLGTEVEIYSELQLIRKNGDYKVYRIENGIKRWIKTAAVFERLGYNWQQISQLDAWEFDSYITANPIE